MRKLLLLLSIVTSAIATYAQPARFSFDKEKIYIHTDHIFFAPGETVFFKLYLVKGADNTPSTISKAVYVEIYTPSGTLAEKQTYPITNGRTIGSYTLADRSPGGIYKLKAYTSWMLNEKDSTLFTKQFTVQKVIAPRILMKLDFPQKGYGPGDKVTADFSMRTLKDQPIANHPGKLTVSLDGQTQHTDSFTTNAAGKAAINFQLPTNLATTDGLLNITVSYDSYTESISKAIPIALNKIDLQFLPEGGSFVAGLPTHLAFKAVNEFGDPVDVKGVIKDNTGQIVASFESYKFGMGMLPFTPQQGQTYTAIITNKQSFALPTAKPTGVVLNIDTAITLSATSPCVVYLAAQCKGATYYSQRLDLKAGANHIPLDTTKFPPGIAQFTLYNESKQPIAERLVYLHPHTRLHVSIVPDKSIYVPREKVTLAVKTTDEKGVPIPADLSLTVLDDKLWTLADDKQDNILSWLSLSSELHGKIEEPQFYFKADEAKAAKALDLVMLTNGYRYFDFTDEVLKTGEIKFPPDENNILNGLLTDTSKTPIPGTVYLIENTAGGKVTYIKSPDGQFFFVGLRPATSYMLIAQPLKRQPAPEIIILRNGLGSSPLNKTFDRRLPINDPLAPQIKTPQLKLPEPPQMEKDKKFLFNPNPKSNALNDVVVVGYGASHGLHKSASVAYITRDELAAVPADGILRALDGKVAGLAITPNANPGQAAKIGIRGMGTVGNGREPLIVINGVPQEKYDLASLDVNSIESVEVMKDAAATALYGAAAVNGAILIRMKTLYNLNLIKPLNRRSRFTTLYFMTHEPAYTVARKFYAPKYQTTATNERNDYRETIYWDPVVLTDSNGEARLEFYNSDATTTFRVMAEGIGFNGKLAVGDTTYAVQAPISVDAKIPPYLTTGDKALIPVVIKNNTSDKLEGSLDLALPANLTTTAILNRISLEPGQTSQILVPVTAIAPTAGDIKFVITSNLCDQSISLPITAAPKGFPITETLSGNTSKTHHFTITKRIPGSLQARLSVYDNVESQLLNGIESMLREPHGCFEQTSSSTYPNIFILKYLRRAGRSNPEIEKKALNYIQQGYQRLISYETPQKGFEWFGHAPAHEALTAYGLLEFTDMQEFLAVDKSMLDRTKDFLLSRRDGNGGFKLSSGGYDRFASVPDKIANIYIVYAMSQAGYGDQIGKEYAAAVRKAAESKDAYQLAMMALAADNMKNEKDYSMLMDVLHKTFPDQKLIAETSVVNSFDASLRVETMSLYALALLRNKTPDLSLVAGLIAKILGEKSYYGYGSTQATVLALEAVSEYAVLTGREAAKGEMKFMLNGHSVTLDDSLTNLLKEGENEFSVQYAGSDPGKAGIPYNLEVSYNAFVPPNSEKAVLHLATTLSNQTPKIGETVRLTVKVENTKDQLQPMAIAKIGIPAGLSVQPWQLKDLIKEKKVAYYEIFDNYLVLYWLGLGARETLNIGLDLKADIPGTYRAKASTVYLYYTPEYKHWNDGLQVEISAAGPNP